MVILRRLLKWAVGLAALTAAVLLGANKLEASFERAFVCGREVRPLTNRAAVDTAAYAAENMALARSIPMLAAGEPRSVDHAPYHRCGERLDSDIVGVRSSFVVMSIAGAHPCATLTSIEHGLVASGWSLDSGDQSMAGRSARIVRATRERQRLDFRFDGGGTSLTVVVDHDALDVLWSPIETAQGATAGALTGEARPLCA